MSLLYAILGLAASSSFHCAVRREISPCTCRQEKFATPVTTNPPLIYEASTVSSIISSVTNNGDADGVTDGTSVGGGSEGGGDSVKGVSAGVSVSSVNHVNNQQQQQIGYGEKITVACEKMESFDEVVRALRGKFTPQQQITLRISHSQLKDISKYQFHHLQMVINKLELNHDHLSTVDSEVFTNLNGIQYLSLADNELPSIPLNILSHLPLIKTLDLSRNRINRIDAYDFKHNPSLQHLLIAGNSISELVPGSLPRELKNLHVGRNHLKSLNKALRDLSQLEWLFINSNELTSLDDELPESNKYLRMLHATDNKLTHLPQDFHRLDRLEMLFLQHNRIRSLNGTLKHASKLKYLEVSYNELQELTEEDFVEAVLLEDLELGHNSLKSLGSGTNNDGNGINSALWPLRSLKCLNLTHNQLSEFTLASLRGLKELRLVDLSNNRIARLYRGPSENLVEEDTDEIPGAGVQDLRLQHNELSSLEGSLFVGMKELQRLNLSHNSLGPTIGPHDFRGLENLRSLDLSHNKLTTLEDISLRLPSLEELNASHNRLVTLSERDFQGFPILCWADLSMNDIKSLTSEVVANTRCTLHGVPDVLRIYLQDNPVLCDAGLVDLTVALEVNYAKVYGVSNCSTTVKPNIEETTVIPSLSPIFLPPRISPTQE